MHFNGSNMLDCNLTTVSEQVKQIEPSIPQVLVRTQWSNKYDISTSHFEAKRNIEILIMDDER